MAQGLSGSNAIQGNEMLVELRAMNAQLQAMLGTADSDELDVLRNDAAFALGLPTPVPGTGR